MYRNHAIAVVIPAFNEEQSIAKTLTSIPGYVDFVTVGDNGSTDRTADIVREHGAVVVHESERGYGAACLKALETVPNNTDIVVFLDADYSDYPEEMILLLDPIVADDCDIVIGSRMLKEESRATLTPVARFGNWLSTRLIRFLWKYEFTDLGPFRASRWSTFQSLDMRDRNFGWTVELQIKAARRALRCREVAVSYRRRIGQSKISGTVFGSIKAGSKILYLIFREWLKR